MNDTKPIISFFARGREIGFVLLESGEIVRYGIKTVRGRKYGQDFVRKVENILLPVLEISEGSRTILIERIHCLSRKGALCRVMEDLGKRWKRQGHSVHRFPLAAVKGKLCERRRVTHRDLVKAILGRYPMFWPLIAHPKAEKVKYWEKVFLAVALAEMVKEKPETR